MCLLACRLKNVFTPHFCFYFEPLATYMPEPNVDRPQAISEDMSQPISLETSDNTIGRTEKHIT